MLIRNSEVWRHGQADIRIKHGRIAAIGALAAQPGESVVEAAGGALLPGLHDHHIHLVALAAKQSSVMCGPPSVTNAEALARALQQPGAGWLRGVGYHESVAGVLDADSLDTMQADRPARIQHRSGRMWFLNSLALDLLLSAAAPPPGLEQMAGRYTGRLFDADDWLRAALRSSPPSLDSVSAELARYGVTGVTEMSPYNGEIIAEHFRGQQRAGLLRQKCLLAGDHALAESSFSDRLMLGPAKLHLHEAQFPALSEATAFIARAHERGRTAAVHCVTEAELVFALAALADAGAAPGDRIEHASIAPDHLIEQICDLGLWVVAQPHFVRERGDQYLADVDPADHASLYRLRAFLDAGIPLAGGSDAPFGGSDPWAAMRAAIARESGGGAVIGADEALTPEEAISLFLAAPDDLRRERRIAIGEVADIALLRRPWSEARHRLTADDVRMTIADGSIIYDCVDQAAGERRLRADARA